MGTIAMIFFLKTKIKMKELQKPKAKQKNQEENTDSK